MYVWDWTEMDITNTRLDFGMATPQHISRPSRREETLRKWEALKDEIRQVYFVENNTLQATMEAIEEKYAFKARLVCPCPPSHILHLYEKLEGSLIGTLLIEAPNIVPESGK